MKTVRSLTAAACAAAFMLASAAPQAVAQSERTLFNIGTGGLTGIFYATAGQICNLVNKSREKQGHALRCTVESTGGSVANLRQLRSGDLDLAFASSDIVYQAYNGVDFFADAGKDEDLRYIMTFADSKMHVVTRVDTGIEKIADLVGKKVNTGNPGSGTEANTYMLLKYFGIDPEKDFELNSKLTSREQSTALCDGKIDAFFFPSGVPIASIEEAANTCDVRLLSLEGPEFDRLLEENTQIGRTIIPAGVYRGHNEDVVTFATAGTLMTTSRLPDEVAYNLVKAVMDGFEDIKQSAPVFNLLDRKTSVGFGRHTPYHPGAERYFKEVGLLD